MVAALDAAQLETGPADAALARLIEMGMEVGWASFDTDPCLLHLSEPPTTARQDRDRHVPVLACLLAIGHAVGEEARAGRMTSAEAIDALRVSIPRLWHGGRV